MPRLMLFLILLGLLYTPLFAEEEQPENTDKLEQAQEAVEAEPGPDYSDLPDCSKIDDQWFWGKQELGFEIIERSNTSVKIRTAIGQVSVKAALFTATPQHYQDTLTTLVKHAQKAGLQSEDKAFLYNKSNITGPRLTRGDHIVLSHGVLTKQHQNGIDEDALQKQITDAVSKVQTHLKSVTSLDKLGRDAIDNVLTRLHWLDAEEEEFDAVPPSFARRVIRHKWLSTVAGTHESIQALEQAVDAASGFSELRLYTGKQAKLRLMGNAFGKRSWILETPEHCIYTTQAPAPVYHYESDDFQAHVQLIVTLPTGSDPLQNPERLLDSTRLVLEDKHSREVIAAWSADGFEADEEAWRHYLRITRDYYVADYVPPHITQIAPNGDIVKIATPHGVLNALSKTDASSMEAFLKNAAEVAQTPGYLDLIGQYMLTYVYDSPDSSVPHLIGSRDINSDIHQTALETLGTSCGGQFRGDCDDLSELYHNILERQGKIPHVVSLPAHAAVAWAELDDDQWHTYVLQTGPALQFTADSLQKSLELAYKHFDESDTFDPNGLGLLLRFSGENTRSGWRLSYRIFKEADYAKTMIDVQRDWHFQTYQRAIHKMLRMIESGDEDTANFRELSGLYSFTGQYAKAAEYHKMAIDRTPEATSRLYMGMEYVQHLIEAKQNDAAIAYAEEILNNELPALKDELGGSELTFALQMASTLNHDGSYDLALQFLNEYATAFAEKNIDMVSKWANSSRFSEDAWYNARDLRQLRRILKWITNTNISILSKRGYDDLSEKPNLAKHFTFINNYIDNILPLEAEETDDVLANYSMIAKSYLISRDIHDLIDDVKNSQLPSNLTYNHRLRLGGIAQYQRDLPWIKLSVPFWFVCITEQFAHDAEKADIELVKTCAAQAEIAFKQAQKLNIAGAFTRKQIHYVRLIQALVSKDADTIRTLLQYVKTKNDKRLRDDTAMWIGDCAKELDLEWYAQVIDIWTAELNYKPKYYWIAWRAALNHAPKHALLVAKRAAELFKTDPAFVEEYEFMKALFTEEQSTDSAE